MSSTQINGHPDFKLEVVAIPVADVDRAKAFYQKLGWTLDIHDREGVPAVQL